MIAKDRGKTARMEGLVVYNHALSLSIISNYGFQPGGGSQATYSKRRARGSQMPPRWGSTASSEEGVVPVVVIKAGQKRSEA